MRETQQQGVHDHFDLHIGTAPGTPPRFSLSPSAERSNGMSEPIVVVGGGAAGLMAAGRAGELGARVLLLEKTPRLGNKLRITGKGRCNLTNECSIADFVSHLGANGAFMHNGFARFFAADLMAFFDGLGVPTVTERGQRVFPASNNAHDVANALRRYCLDHGVRFRYRSPVTRVLTREGKVCGVSAGDRVVPAKRVVLATGGFSYPATGSTGDGFGIAQDLGHQVTSPRPGLVPLVTEGDDAQHMQGLSLRNVRASLYQKGALLASEFGEMLFTHYGVSGPIILTLSVAAAYALEHGPLRLAIDLKPALDAQKLDLRLQRDLAHLGKGTYRGLLKGLLPRAMIDVFIARSGISADQRPSQFTTEHRRTVIGLLKCFEFTVTRTRPLAEAIITLGGVSPKEIDPQTMASRLVQGLYFAGELIDVAGDTGGYNLQIAFTTGYLAGEHAALSVAREVECSD